MKYRKFSAAALALICLSFASCEQVGNNSDPSFKTNTWSSSSESAPAETNEPETTPAEPDSPQPQTDKAAETPVRTSDKGTIYDVDGRVLLYTEKSADGSARRVASPEYAEPFANIITEMSDGYDTVFADQLTVPGQAIELTIDAEVQKSVYDYMAANEIVGSVVALRSDGSIIAQVSYPSYDPNTVADQSYDENLAWGTVGNKAFQNYEPGSCFKIMSEVIADKHGIYSLYDEGEWVFDGTSIVNWDHDTNFGYPMERTLSSAFINSSNIFFAKAFDQIGAEDVLNDLNTIFHFDKNIECDFGTINNNVEIYCEDDLRRTAFGQSYVLTCPIYLAALGREAGFGDMVKPFVLKSIVKDGSPENVIAAGSQPGEIIASIPENCRQNLQSGMHGVASDIGVYVPDGYVLYAKTGTAETWINDFLYITGCAKKLTDTGNNNYDYANYGSCGSYSVVMQIQNPQKFGYEFASQSAGLYQGIINCIIGN